MLLAAKQTLNPSTSHYLPCDLVKQWSWCKPYSVLTWVIFILSKLVSFIYSGLFADESISQNNYFHVTALPEFLWKIPISLGIEGSPYHGGRSLLQCTCVRNHWKSKMLYSVGSTCTWFKVTLISKRLFFISERNSGFNIPRGKLGCMRNMSGVVHS